MLDVMNKERTKFLGLSDDVLEKFTDHQRNIYNVLRDASEELAAAEADAEAAAKSLHAAAEGLRASQEEARLRPRTTFLDEHKAMIAQRKIDRGIQP